MENLLLTKNENIIQIFKQNNVMYVLTNKNRIFFKHDSATKWDIYSEFKQFNA